MRRLTKYVTKMKYSFTLAMLVTALLIFVVVPGIQKYEQTMNNMVSIFINGEQVGTVKDPTEVNGMVLEARKKLASGHKELVLTECNVVLNGSKDVVGQIDEREVIVDNIYNVLKKNVMKTKQPAYEVKIGEFTLILPSIDDVVALLNAAKSEYDTDCEWNVEIVTDTSRELDVYTAKVEKVSTEAKHTIDKPVVFPKGGAILHMEDLLKSAYSVDIEDMVKLGVKSLDFDEKVEVVQAYVDADKIDTLEEAIEKVTKREEKSKKYEVQSGDTLGAIAAGNDTTIEQIMKLNPDTIKSESTMLLVGEELTIYSPEPELSVLVVKRKYYHDYYEVDPIIIDVDDEYTTYKVTVQEPVTGYRRVIADLTYRNSELIDTNVLHEEVVVKPVPKIIKRGTKTPPTYMYPVSGRISSGFGKRKAPKKGASTYHKGIDFAVPVGTAVRASSGGTVIRAGWGSGYGYCVYIQHPDGKVTRYGHLSKILVKNGQSVSQGDKIALSGNTGVSTGPHLHFEILVGGGQVNPLNYIN